LAPNVKMKTVRRKTSFTRNPLEKRKGNQQNRQMHTQILSKNELVIKAEEEKWEQSQPNGLTW